MEQKPISRRTAIKVLLSGGVSIAALSFLPEKWVKPVVSTGVLPVHAQTSLTSGISGTIYDGLISNPLSGVVVTAHASFGKIDSGSYKLASPKAANHPHTTTASDGTYSLPLTPGDYFVELEYGGCGTGANGGSNVTVNTGAFTTLNEDFGATSCGN